MGRCFVVRDNDVDVCVGGDDSYIMVVVVAQEWR